MPTQALWKKVVFLCLGVIFLPFVEKIVSEESATLLQLALWRKLPVYIVGGTLAIGTVFWKVSLDQAAADARASDGSANSANVSRVFRDGPKNQKRGY
jgi:ABC-type cobalamin transport system permease subunit